MPRTLAEWTLGSLLFLLPGVAFGSTFPETGLAQLGIERWGTESGLAGSWVRDIEEGRDGFLWIATSRGLSRFDGRSIVNLTAENSPGLPTSSISALALGAGDLLWVGLEHGGVRRLHAGRIETDPRLAGLPEDSAVRDLVEDPAGVLWVATTRGLWRTTADAIERVSPDAGGADIEVSSLLMPPDGGEIWARTLLHGIWRVRGGDLSTLPEIPGCRGYGLAVESIGNVFTSCDGGIFRWHRAAGWSTLTRDEGVGPLFLDRRGALWYGARTGLLRRMRGAVDVLPVAEGLGDRRVRAFFEDRRGDLWIGTYASGLTRLRRGAIRAFGVRESMPVTETTAVLAQPNGDLLVGGLGHGLVRWNPVTGVVGHWGSANGLAGETPWSLALDPRRPEGVWVGAERGLTWLQAGAMRRRGPAGIAYEGDAHLVYVDPATADTLWIAGLAGGATELRPGHRILHHRNEGLGLDRVRFFHRDRAGRLLAGGDGGVFRLERERWQPVYANGRPLLGSLAIHEEVDGTLWVGSTSAGLVRFGRDGSSTSYSQVNGLPLPAIVSLEQDVSGGLWLSGDQGLVRFRLEDHERWRRGELGAIPFERLGRREGLRDVECNGWGRPSSTRLPDGTLAYPTITGVALVDSTLLRAVELAPEKIYVDAAWTGIRRLALERPLRLARDERSLRIGFSAIELIRPEAVSFRYRLDGFDDDWIAASRVTEAAYARLAPGEFRFRVQARLPGRAWVESARSLQVEVQPHLWETAWLRASVVGLLLALGFGAFLWRIRVERRHAVALGKERSFLRQVIDTSPNPIFARRTDGTYSLANRAAASVYGLAPEDLQGRSPQELGRDLPGMERVDALDAEVLESRGERQLREDEIVDHEGRRRWFRVVKRPGFGLDGRNVECVIGTAVDVTDYKLAELETRRLSLRLLHAQEDERRALAREIHDDFTQRLAGLAMQAWSTLQTLSKDGGVDPRKSLQELGTELERIANDIQGLSRELHPRALESLGLAEALKQECSTFCRRTGLAVTFESSGRPEEPKLEVGLALYRIAQEALRNCLTHSGSGTAVVRLVASATEVRLEIADSGAGFDAALALRSPGLGLSGMRERTRLAGGTLELDTAPGRGTCIRVRVPVGPGRDDPFGTG